MGLVQPWVGQSPLYYGVFCNKLSSHDLRSLLCRRAMASRALDWSNTLTSDRVVTRQCIVSLCGKPRLDPSICWCAIGIVSWWSGLFPVRSGRYGAVYGPNVPGDGHPGSR